MCVRMCISMHECVYVQICVHTVGDTYNMQLSFSWAEGF